MKNSQIIIVISNNDNGYFKPLMSNVNIQLNIILGHICDACNKIYLHKESLYNHKRYECGKEAAFVCPVDNCAYASKRTGNLKRHIRVIHNTIRNKRY